MCLALAALAAALAFAGCGGGDDSRTAEETAEAWVAAVNEKDYDEACDLSVAESQARCVELIKRAGLGRNLRVETFWSDLDERPGDQPRFTISSNAERSPGGWTAYAPLSLPVERHGNEWLVRWEVGGSE